MSDRLVRSAPGKRAAGSATARRQGVVRWGLSRRLLTLGVIAVAGLSILGSTSPSRSGIYWHQVSSADAPPAIQLLPSARLATPTALADALRESRVRQPRTGFAGAPVTASLMDLDRRLLPSAEALLPRADYLAAAIEEPLLPNADYIAAAIDEPAQDVTRRVTSRVTPGVTPRAKPAAKPTVEPQVAQRPARTPQPPAANAVTRHNFPQWVSVQEKSWAWDVLFESACTDIMGRSCRLDAWQGFLDGLRGVNADFQLASVNREINRIRYREDVGNWGEIDYWAAPGEFFAAGGDCEDYAIAKYYSLKELGFAPDKMRIVVLQDELRQRPHAVLVVEFGGELLMLDNMINQVVPWAQAREYRPFYSVNEDAFWLHEGRELS